MPDSADILTLTARIVHNPSLGHTTAELGALAGWSEAHLHRDFHKVTLETPKRWATRVRMARALELLAEPAHSVGDVSGLLGFGSHEVFTRAFRRTFGVPPSALRSLPTAHVRHAACLGLYHLSHHRGPTMNHSISIQNLPAQPVLFMRRSVPLSELQAAMAECLPAVFVYCQQQGLTMAGPPYTRYIEMTRGSCTIEAGIPVVAPAEGAGEILSGSLPAGEAAVTVHVGPYDRLGEAHSALEAFAGESGRAPSGGPWEVYLTDPGQVPDPAEWKTQVALPLA